MALTLRSVHQESLYQVLLLSSLKIKGNNSDKAACSGFCTSGAKMKQRQQNVLKIGLMRTHHTMYGSKCGDQLYSPTKKQTTRWPHTRVTATKQRVHANTILYHTANTVYMPPPQIHTRRFMLLELGWVGGCFWLISRFWRHGICDVTMTSSLATAVSLTEIVVTITANFHLLSFIP